MDNQALTLESSVEKQCRFCLHTNNISGIRDLSEIRFEIGCLIRKWDKECEFLEKLCRIPQPAKSGEVQLSVKPWQQILFDLLWYKPFIWALFGSLSFILYWWFWNWMEFMIWCFSFATSSESRLKRTTFHLHEIRFESAQSHLAILSHGLVMFQVWVRGSACEMVPYICDFKGWWVKRQRSDCSLKQHSMSLLSFHFGLCD